MLTTCGVRTPIGFARPARRRRQLSRAGRQSSEAECLLVVRPDGRQRRDEERIREEIASLNPESLRDLQAITRSQGHARI